MKIGQKPYLVGEEGPELILPREDGDAFVLPADITRQVLPAMRDVTPRKAGGVMESKGGRFAALDGVSSSGNPATGSASRLPTTLYTPSAQARAQENSYFVDPQEGRYLLDNETEGMPLLPDPVEGPWAGPGMPAPTRAEHRATVQKGVDSVMRMPGVRAASKYPGQLFADAAPGAPAQMIPFEELQQRVADRSVDANNTLFDIRDRAERDRVQRDLQARASRVPLGTPTAPLPPLPGMSSFRPSTRRAIDRNMERFLRTPQGALYATEQAQQQQAAAASAQAAGQWEMVNDPVSGKPFVMVNGRGQTVSLPKMEEDEQLTFVDTQKPDPLGIGMVTVREPRIYNRRSGTMRAIPMEGDQPSVENASPTVSPSAPKTGIKPGGRFLPAAKM
jgi:hypothetical protein